MLHFQPDLYNQNNHFQKKDSQLIYDKLKEVYKKKVKVLLDIGSGSGNLTKELEKYVDCEKIIGVDKSHLMKDYAQSKYGSENIIFVYGDIADSLDQFKLQINQPENSIDIITSAYCLHWVEDKRAAMRNISSMLKPGGRCFLLFFSWSDFLPIQEEIVRHSNWVHVFEKFLKVETINEPDDKTSNTSKNKETEVESKKQVKFKASAPFCTQTIPSVEERLQYWKNLCKEFDLTEVETIMHDACFTFQDSKSFKDLLTSICHYVSYLEPNQKEPFLKDYFEHMQSFYISKQKNLPKIKVEYQFITVFAQKKHQSPSKKESKDFFEKNS